jgi:formate acetyltransferase 1
MERFDAMMEWLCKVYVNTLNIIHYMHDKYCYEKIQMALHDKKVTRWFATGIAGLSVVADSLSAIKYAKVKVIRDETGLAVDYEVEGEFPKYGNDDDRVDSLANMILHKFMEHVRKNHTYRDSIPTTSILTITSNVVYGKAVGLGYSLFASKALGAEYSYAFATSKISLFDTQKGAMIELAGVTEENNAQAEARYADEVQDPVNAARKGYIDDIIEPQFVRSHIISALQLVTR